MSSKRTQIRAALVDLLTGLATAGANVFGSRLYPLTASQLPAILVTTLDQDPVGHFMATGAAIQRSLVMRIDLVVKKAEGFEDTLDTMLDEVLSAIFASHASRTFSGLVQPIDESPVGEPEFDESTDKPVARLPLLLRVIYTP